MAHVTFIVGDHNQGKTSRLIQLTKTLTKGTYNGYACVKRFSKQNELQGYDLVCLSSLETREALTYKTLYQDEFKDYFVYGPFVFSKDAFYNAEQDIHASLEDPKITTILMDEIGRVELMELGYAWILKEVLKTDKHLILCVNSRHLENVIKHFKIKDYELIVVT